MNFFINYSCFGSIDEFQNKIVELTTLRYLKEKLENLTTSKKKLQ